MTSTTIPNLADAPRPRPLITPTGWAWIAALTIAFVAMHFEFISRMVMASRDPNWSHILIVPLISLYYLMQHKDRLAATPRRVCWWGLPLLLLGIYSYFWWIYPGRNDMFRGYSMIISLFGLALLLLGPAAMRVVWFPIAYLVFAVKIPDALWERIANALQDIAARGAGVTLNVAAVFVDFTPTREGNQITLGFMQDGRWVEEGLNIAEACSGLRMLMAFVALGVALAFLWDRAWWQRLIMIAMAIPIALAVNIARVTALGLIYLVDKRYAQGDFHIFVGMLMLIPAAGLFLLLGWVLDRIVIRDEADREPEPRPVAPHRAGPTGRATPGRIAVFVAAGLALAVVGGALYAASFAWLPPLSMAWFFGRVPGLNAFADVPLPVAPLVPAALGLVAVVAWRRWSKRRRNTTPPPPAGGAANRFALGSIIALACGLLLGSTLGMQAVVAWQGAVLLKKEVDLRHPLTLLPLDKAGWTFLRDDVLSPEVVDALGTEQYLSRLYEDTSIPEGQPGRIVRVHIAYYTGLVDTVPHVPDRCFVAGGMVNQGVTGVALDIDAPGQYPNPDGLGVVAPAVLANPLGATADPDAGTLAVIPDPLIDATRFTFLPGPAAPPSHVIYFFAANGKYLSSPNAVRLQGFDITDKHSYYCKIEVMVVGEADPDSMRKRTEAFLDVFLPEIMAALPDWHDVQAGRWPRSGATP